MSLALEVNDLERRCINAEGTLDMIHSLCTTSAGSTVVFYIDQPTWTPTLDALSKLMIKAGIKVSYRKSKDELGVVKSGD